MKFTDTLEILLEDENHTAPKMQQAAQLVQRLDTAKQLVVTIKHQLMQLRNQINAELAMQIRRTMPALHVGLDHGMCKVGYKTKSLLLTPDLERGIWTVKSPDGRFATKFHRSYIRDMLIGPDTEQLISAIVKHFTDHFKTIGEDLIGNGLLLIEGKHSQLADLVKYRQNGCNNFITRRSRECIQNV